jgi:hypothetical protein
MKIEGDKKLPKVNSERFEELLRTIGAGPWKDALVEVCDTAFMVKVWFASYGIAATASDIVAMTALVVGRAPKEGEEA